MAVPVSCFPPMRPFPCFRDSHIPWSPPPQPSTPSYPQTYSAQLSSRPAILGLTHREENGVSTEGSVLAVTLDSCQADPGSERKTEPRRRMPRVDLVSEAQSGKKRGEEKGWVEGRRHFTAFGFHCKRAVPPPHADSSVVLARGLSDA